MHEAQQQMGTLQHACQMIISKMLTGFIKLAQANRNAFASSLQLYQKSPTLNSVSFFTSVDTP